MKVSIKHTTGMEFEATTEKNTFIVNPKGGISPMEYFAVGLISCSGTDMVAIPESQGLKVENLSIEADITRAEEMPKKFDEIHMIYTFDSTADATTATRWVQGSIETYCSTINTVRGVSEISYTIIYNGEKIADKKKIISGQATTDFGEIGGACES